jgi:hypothetical protein
MIQRLSGLSACYPLKCRVSSAWHTSYFQVVTVF